MTKSKTKEKDSKQLQPATENSPAKRFQITVERLMSETAPAGATMTEKEKQLIQHYFVGVDRALEAAELRRWGDNNLEYDWNNVDLEDLALQVVDAARWGLDILMKNHVFAIPYKNSKTNKYTVNLMLGYNGIKMKALKYAQDQPVDVTIELVKETDHFKPLKKDWQRDVEGYEFEITNVWDRGQVVGGFGYLEFEDPRKNKLIVMTLEDIEKRKPDKASPEFWGGEKDIWKNGKKQKEKEQVEGWFEEMCYKTLIREVFSEKHMPLDPDKLDAAYNRQVLREIKMAEFQAQEEIAEKANKEFLEFKDVTPEDEFAAEMQDDHLLQTQEKEPEPEPESEQDQDQDPEPAQEPQPPAPESAPEYNIPTF